MLCGLPTVSSEFSVHGACPPLSATALQRVTLPSLKVAEPWFVGLMVLGLFAVTVAVNVTDWP